MRSVEFSGMQLYLNIEQECLYNEIRDKKRIHEEDLNERQQMVAQQLVVKNLVKRVKDKYNNIYFVPYDFKTQTSKTNQNNN